VVRSDAGSFVHLEDPDGNEIYLWEKVGRTTSEAELVEASAG
jgi:hypothetical protein